MTLEEKLAAIDEMMASAPTKLDGHGFPVPVDPDDALMCEGCQ